MRVALVRRPLASPVLLCFLGGWPSRVTFIVLGRKNETAKRHEKANK